MFADLTGHRDRRRGSKTSGEATAEHRTEQVWWGHGRSCSQQSWELWPLQMQVHLRVWWKVSFCLTLDIFRIGTVKWTQAFWTADGWPCLHEWLHSALKWLRQQESAFNLTYVNSQHPLLFNRWENDYCKGMYFTFSCLYPITSV